MSVNADQPPPDTPTCDRCGAEITTGAMAAWCAHRERCEFWPDDEASQQLLDDLGWRVPVEHWPPIKENTP
jgi:hypothetical protein